MAIGQRGVLVGNMAYASGIGQCIDAMGMMMTTHRKIQKVSGRLGCWATLDRRRVSLEA
jgi:hypothetical protein